MAQFVNDTFTGTAGTLLSAHVGEIGATWTKNAVLNVGQITIGTNDAYSSNGAAVVYLASGTGTSADYQVDADLSIVSLIGSSHAGIVGRWSASASTGYVWDFVQSPSAFTLYRDVAGTFTNLGFIAYSPSPGDTYHMRLILYGTSLKGEIQATNGANSGKWLTSSGTWSNTEVACVSVTDSTITAANFAGLYGIGNMGATTGERWDNFTAADYAPPGATGYGNNGPSSGTVSVASTAFTVTPNGVLASNDTVTLSDGGQGGTFKDSSNTTVTSLSFPSGSSTAKTFTYTPATSGAKTLTLTSTLGLTLTPTTSPYTSNAVVTPTSQIVFKGDSLTYGQAATSGQGTTSGTVYPAVALTYLGSTWAGSNKGVQGQQVTTMLTNGASEVDSLYNATTYPNGQFVVFFGGTNDIGATSNSAASIYANIVAYHNARRTVGWKTVAVTIPHSGYSTGYPRSGTTNFNPIADALNALIRANWRTFANALIDLAADSRMLDATDLTYRQTDQTHFTDAGYAITAQYVVPGVWQAQASSAVVYASAANVLAGIDRGDGIQGTYVSPSVANVRLNQGYGAGGTSLLGTLVVPPANKVLSDTTFDNGTVGTATISGGSSGSGITPTVSGTGSTRTITWTNPSGNTNNIIVVRYTVLTAGGADPEIVANVPYTTTSVMDTNRPSGAVYYEVLITP